MPLRYPILTLMLKLFEGLRTHNDGTVLHVWVNRAEDVAIPPESARFVCDEGDCMLLSGWSAKAPVVVVHYREPVNFSAVIVDDCDDHCVT